MSFVKLGLSVLVAAGLPMSAQASPPAQSNGGGNSVSICHYDGQDRVHEISVNGNATAAHFANHGDHAPITFYLDADEDGFGDPDEVVEACSQPDGYVENDDDCVDGDGGINPAADETCGDAIDNNCSGEADEDCTTCPCFDADDLSSSGSNFDSCSVYPLNYVTGSDVFLSGDFEGCSDEASVRYRRERMRVPPYSTLVYRTCSLSLTSLGGDGATCTTDQSSWVRDLTEEEGGACVSLIEAEAEWRGLTCD